MGEELPTCKGLLFRGTQAVMTSSPSPDAGSSMARLGFRLPLRAPCGIPLRAPCWVPFAGGSAAHGLPGLPGHAGLAPVH